MVSKTSEEATSQLERLLTLRDLVLFNLVAVIGITWLGTSAKAGPAALTLWLLAAVFFFIPQGLAVIELSSSFPAEGGIYPWAKLMFGEGHGFLCGWCYWINNVLYYPSYLLTAAVIATYAIGRGDTGLADNWTYVLTFTLAALWFAVVINIVGLGTGRWLQNIGGLGSYLPGILLVGVGIYAFFALPPVAAYKAHDFVPDFRNFAGLNLWATIAFAFAGLELSSTMGSEIEQPRRNLPRSIFISAPLIALFYIAGTWSLLRLVPVDEINIVAGPYQAIAAAARHIGGYLWWLALLGAAASAIGRIGAVGAWLTGPARVAFVVGLDRYFPQAFGRVHPRWHTPYVAILVQALLATVFLLVSIIGKGRTVEKAFLILIDTSLLIYFIPYIYLFASYMAHCWRARADKSALNAPGGWPGGIIIGALGLFVTVFAMIFAMIPPPNTADPWIFELKVAGGAIALLLFGGIIYWRAKIKSNRRYNKAKS